jgi:hypothetical protein
MESDEMEETNNNGNVTQEIHAEILKNGRFC